MTDKLKKIVMDAHNLVTSNGICSIIGGELMVSSSEWPRKYKVGTISGTIIDERILFNEAELPLYCDRIAVVDEARQNIVMGDYPHFCGVMQDNQVLYKRWKSRCHHVTKLSYKVK